MSTIETGVRELVHWPSDASVAYVFADDVDVIELVVTTDGRAILDGRELRVAEHVAVGERRSGLAAMAAGMI
jgi:hypothetical protein